MTIKERIEANAVLWLLGCLLTGFLSGISAYRAVQEMAGLEPVSKSDYQDLQKKAKELESELAQAKGNPNRTTRSRAVSPVHSVEFSRTKECERQSVVSESISSQGCRDPGQT